MRSGWTIRSIVWRPPFVPTATFLCMAACPVLTALCTAARRSGRRPWRAMPKMSVFGAPGGKLEVLAGAATKLQHVTLGVDDDVGGRIAVQQLALGERRCSRASAAARDRTAASAAPCPPARSAGTGSRRFELRAAAEDAVPLVDGGEQARLAGQVLGAAEEQVAALVERVVEQRDQPVLQVGREIDQEVAAGDQVELGERRVAQQVVRREQADLAQVRAMRYVPSSRTK